jgi:hypothetical protein
MTQYLRLLHKIAERNADAHPRLAKYYKTFTLVLQQARRASSGVEAPVLERYEASSRLLLWQAERNYLPVFFRPCPLRGFFSEAARYEEFNDLRHKSPHTCKNRTAARKF